MSPRALYLCRITAAELINSPEQGYAIPVNSIQLIYSLEQGYAIPISPYLNPKADSIVL
jgi:hypothetical protein